ncbi:AraC-like DNA-binding protein [Pedobacter sp. W3I1]|uniref:helix-turn-helix domain-containing protein n=1 Tax=Pedobacter sp. W3I1 TaxID=3042291 RepID=UPI00278942D0|nr:helix-turn-helix domain-containing protein [Pedobacter sp. W3I1]MDQ0640217.1 AraC-like DNA-binding protein [Pedobacter sp. W3I1]
MLKYLEMSSESPLNSYVRKFWILDNSESGLVATTKHALPNTCITIAIIHGDGLIIDFPNNPISIARGSYLVGEITKATGVMVLPYTKAFMVQLNPWAATLLSNCSFHELTNQFAAIADINRELARSFIDINVLDNKGTKQQILKALELYLYPTGASTLIASCFNLFESHSPFIPLKIAALSDHTGYTVRGIEKKFRRHVGLTPKQAFTIMKVRSVVNELISSTGNLSLTALAYKYGYTDQSHFTRSYFCIMDSLPSKFNKLQYILPLQT